jgi:hypothetical protein
VPLLLRRPAVRDNTGREAELLGVGVGLYDAVMLDNSFATPLAAHSFRDDALPEAAEKNRN